MTEAEFDRVVAERVARWAEPVDVWGPPKAGHQRKCRECHHRPQWCGEHACHEGPCRDGERAWDGFSGVLV